MDMSSSTRRVNIGTAKGETPKKVFYFNKEDEPTRIQKATPERDGIPLKGALRVRQEQASVQEVDPFASPTQNLNQGRPTTSRGKARPSPDEFANYVVPSPDRSYLKSVASTLVFDEYEDSSTDQEGSYPGREFKTGKNSTETDSDSDPEGSQSESEPEEMGASGATRNELTALACWLFGSAFAV
jgi:hypothetical protein